MGLSAIARDHTRFVIAVKSLTKIGSLQLAAEEALGARHVVEFYVDSFGFKNFVVLRDMSKKKKKKNCCGR
jgi:hypothetical protein